ncbi:Inx2 [Cordylochernes scorpioides]|uniref:Innexin n=1 Tax=Cordylochernes scorpioides TaxID=51811 RepID=A0ABY6K1W6_9ARAC|nr:Inx2 [Cordylochernes scorpioides]
MLSIADPLKKILKPGPQGRPDSLAFRLHRQITMVGLLAGSLLVTSRQYFGDPIKCIQRDDVPPALLETYCWVYATFTVPSAFELQVGVQVPQPGVDRSNDERAYHQYYQWVAIVLALQGLVFYLPWAIWGGLEHGLLSSLVSRQKHGKEASIVDYLRLHQGAHQSYFWNYLICESLNFINVLVQFQITNVFLDGSFTPLGSNYISYIRGNLEVDPLLRLFPRMSKCIFHRFGSSGDVQKLDALCILPLNILHEKIYIALWFWYILLAVLSAFLLAYHCVSGCHTCSERDAPMQEGFSPPSGCQDGYNRPWTTTRGLVLAGIPRQQPGRPLLPRGG